MHEGKDQRLRKWEDRLARTKPGTEAHAIAEKMVATFTKHPEGAKPVNRIDKSTLERLIIEQIRATEKYGQSYRWNLDFMSHERNQLMKFSNGAGGMEQVRVMVRDDTVYYKTVGTDWTKLGTMTLNGFEPIGRETPRDRIREAQRQAGTGYLSEEAVAAALRPRHRIGIDMNGNITQKPVTRGIDMYPEPKTFQGTNYPAQAHVHFALTDVNRENMMAAFNGTSLIKETKSQEYNRLVKEANAMSTLTNSPDDMEKAALRLAALAQEIRDFDAREPEGEEPVISWENEYQGKTYTFVAFKANKEEGGNGKWYVTGPVFGGRAYVWRDFLDQEFTKALRDGVFHVVAEWTQVGE